MSTVTDNDLREVKDLVNRVITQNEQINEKLNDMRVELATVREGVNSLDKRLDTVEANLLKRIDGIDTRLNTLIAVTFTALLGIIGKLIFLK